MVWRRSDCHVLDTGMESLRLVRAATALYIYPPVARIHPGCECMGPQPDGPLYVAEQLPIFSQPVSPQFGILVVLRVPQSLCEQLVLHRSSSLHPIGIRCPCNDIILHGASRRAWDQGPVGIVPGDRRRLGPAAVLAEHRR